MAAPAGRVLMRHGAPRIGPRERFGWCIRVAGAVGMIWVAQPAGIRRLRLLIQVMRWAEAVGVVRGAGAVRVAGLGRLVRVAPCAGAVGVVRGAEAVGVAGLGRLVGIVSLGR